MKNKLLIILAIASVVTVGRSVYLKNTHPSQDTAVASQQQPFVYQSKGYIALETNSLQMSELSQNILDGLARRIKNRWSRVDIDIFVGKEVQNLYSQAATRRDLEALIEQVKLTPSSDQALIKAIQRFKDEVFQNKQQHVYGLIVTKGTANSSSLAAIRQICQKLAQNSLTKMHIAIVGLSPENRLPMSTAVAALGGNVQFAGAAQEEWQQLIRF
ncbi:MAG: hypothetical protein DSM106950_00545 [Stigonema ocellatum SAG 48.90 = DSM 106950]|nr:hypothetical protein [Stigonema ocellatum SAG 48.90 = DSM 106950]